MNQNANKIALALFCLALPIVILAVWASSLAYERAHAQSYHVIVEGYDPRDPMRGKYLDLRYVWTDPRSQKPQGDIKTLPDHAEYYIPDEDALDLQQMLILGKNAFSADVIVMGRNTRIKTLQIDNKPWKETLDAWRQSDQNPWKNKNESSPPLPVQP